MTPSTRKIIHAGVLQFSPVTGAPDANLQTAVDWFDRLPQPIDLAVLPEVWPAGYGCRKLAQEIAPWAEAIIERLGETARKQACYISGSIPYPAGESERCYNRAILIDPEGRMIAHYDKVHLFAIMKEPEIMVPGDDWIVIDTAIGKIGLGVCFDIRFPEFIRQMALAGMEILLLPVQWPHPRLDHYQTLLRARAIENQCFVVAANRNGSANKIDFFGHSMIVDPWGKNLVDMPEDQTGWGITEIDPAKIAEAQSRLGVFPARRPKVYEKKNRNAD